MKPGTTLVHAGTAPDPTTGAIMTPIYQTSTYVQDEPGRHKGYEYARTDNPTRHALEDALAAAEGARHAVAFGSGMAAVDALLKLLAPGDHVAVTWDLYGGTLRLMTRVFAPYGIRFSFVDCSNLANLEAALTPQTRMIWLETPTNPVLSVLDVAGAAALAKQVGALLVVDNTFASPYLQQPLALGADVAMHSLTKYIGGHSDLVMGAVMLNDPELHQRLKFLQNSCGAVPGPMDSFLALRGLKTLHLRMERHSHNAAAVANKLAGHPKVAHVNYPGLPSHPGHALARQQMRLFGGMLSFRLNDDSMEAAIRFMKALKLFSLAESLGGVESLVGHPASMTHASIPREQRLASGVADSLIRLSVGIEDVEDLLADLDAALNAA